MERRDAEAIIKRHNVEIDPEDDRSPETIAAALLLRELVEPTETHVEQGLDRGRRECPYFVR